MALIVCKECGNQISDAAQACPQCGAPASLSLTHTEDPKAANIFRNPLTRESLDISKAWLWCLLFGVFYFLYRRAWTHAAISAVGALFTAGLSWIIYPFFARAVMRSQLTAKGWTAVK